MESRIAPTQSSAVPGPGGGRATAITTCGVLAVLLMIVWPLGAAVRALRGAPPVTYRLAWDTIHGDLVVGVDALSAFFLIPLCVLAPLAAVYGGSYLFAYRGRKSLLIPWLSFATFVGSMVLVVIARSVVAFLFSWELMSLSAFFLVVFEHEHKEVRQAGWIYLVAAHFSVALLLAAFLILGRSAGSLEFAAMRQAAVPSEAWAGLVFVLAAIGFGTKAGLVPFHVWLPEAHPAAPSHVSAVMSGVMIKLGIYGLLRVVTLLGPLSPWWGLMLASLGLVTAVVGVSLALSQRDVKRTLAYSSIENVGLIALAIGVGLWAWTQQLVPMAILAMTAGLLHVWNHAIMKGLMFLTAGSVLHGTGTRDQERLGGLLQRMPWTGGSMVIGAVAIAGLPPLNGFVGEWLIYLSLSTYGAGPSDGGGLTAMLGVGLVALVGGLAALTFARLVGIVLLGVPRSESARGCHESSAWMLAPMVLLVVLCLGMSVAPRVVVSPIPAVLKQILPLGSSEAFERVIPAQAPLGMLGAVQGCTLLGILSIGSLLMLYTTRQGRRRAPTWGCGYLEPTPRMQYTGRSFSEAMAEHVLPRSLRPRMRVHRPLGLFPARSDFLAECPDPIESRVYSPFFGRLAGRFTQLRVLQQGRLNIYLIYVLVAVVLGLAWSAFRR